MSSQRIDISYTSIFRILAVLAVLFFAYVIRDVIAIVFVAVFFAAAITPWVNWFNSKGIPRALAVLIIYLAGFIVLSMVVVLIIPVVVDQVGQLSNNFPEYYERVVSGFAQLRQTDFGGADTAIQDPLQSLRATFNTATQSVFATIASVFGGLVSFLVLLVLTFYMVINEQMFTKFVQLIVPIDYREYAVSFIKRAQVKLGKWLRGQLFLMLFIAVLTYIGLMILGVKYALMLALIAGIFELIPYAGPILSAVPAIIIALTISPIKGILVVVLYFVIQQIENNFLVPKVMQHAVGLNPIITIIAILVGVKLGGAVGAILAVPVTTMVSMLLSDLYDKRHERAKGKA